MKLEKESKSAVCTFDQAGISLLLIEDKLLFNKNFLQKFSDFFLLINQFEYDSSKMMTVCSICWCSLFLNVGLYFDLSENYKSKDHDALYTFQCCDNARTVFCYNIASYLHNEPSVIHTALQCWGNIKGAAYKHTAGALCC